MNLMKKGELKMKQENDFIPFDNEVIHKEIDLIQGIINRMGQNSFFIKGWCVTLLTIICTYLIKECYSNCILSISLIIIVCIFWYLDSKYYQIERLYRVWYDFMIINTRVSSNQYKYVINPRDIKQILNDQTLQSKSFKIPNIFNCLFNKTIFSIYLGLIIIIIIQFIM